MKNLVIIGAGGYGREAFTLGKQSHGYGTEFIIKGYLDSNVNALEKFNGYPPVLGTIEDYSIEENDVFICAIGDNKRKAKTVQEVLDKGGTFLNLIHTSAYIGDGVELGVGVFIAYDVVISNDTTIGDYVLINSRALIGHDCEVEPYSHLGVGSFLAGSVKVGKYASVNAHATILQRKEIGAHAVVGMASVVTKNVEKATTVFGNPAKRIF